MSELTITENVRRAVEETAILFTNDGPDHLRLPKPYAPFFLTLTTEGYGDSMFLDEFFIHGRHVYLYMG